MEVKSFNRIVVSTSKNFDLSGVGFYQSDYYAAEGMKGYSYSTDAREVFIAFNGMEGSKIQPHGSDSIRSSIIARYNPEGTNECLGELGYTNTQHFPFANPASDISLVGDTLEGYFDFTTAGVTLSTNRRRNLADINM